jgi:hypothetical protein
VRRRGQVRTAAVQRVVPGEQRDLPGVTPATDRAVGPLARATIRTPLAVRFAVRRS